MPHHFKLQLNALVFLSVKILRTEFVRSGGGGGVRRAVHRKINVCAHTCENFALFFCGKRIPKVCPSVSNTPCIVSTKC